MTALERDVMTTLELKLFGGFEARLDGERVEVRSNKAKALLAYLALTPGKAHSRGELLALLWSDRSEEQARRSLRQELVGLRKCLNGVAESVLRVGRESLALEARATEVDVVSFLRLLGEGGGEEALDAAIGLYGGEFLGALHIRDRAFEEWVELERSRFHGLAVGALLKRLAQQFSAEAHDAALRSASRLLELEPANEQAHRALMRLYAERGQRERALRQYERCRERLEEDLGVAPEAATEELLGSIRGDLHHIIPLDAGADGLAPGLEGGLDRPRYVRRERDRSLLWIGILTAVFAGGYFGWSWWESSEELAAERAHRQSALEWAKGALQRRSREVEQAKLTTVKLETEGKRREALEAARRAELERELAALERELAEQERKLRAMERDQALAAAEREAELERLGAEGARRKSELAGRLATLEERRVALERSRLALEQARAKVESERAEEIERRQAAEAARAQALAEQRTQLERERERLSRERAEAESARLAELERIKAEETVKRAALEAQVAKLKRQRDALKRRLEALGAMVAETGSETPAEAQSGSESPAEAPAVDEAKLLAAFEAWKRAEATVTRARAMVASFEPDPEEHLIPSARAPSAPDLTALASTPSSEITPPSVEVHGALTSEPGVSTYKIAFLPLGGRIGSSTHGPLVEKHLTRELTVYLENERSLELTYSYDAVPSPGLLISPEQIFPGGVGATSRVPDLKAVTELAEQLGVEGAVTAWYMPASQHQGWDRSRVVLYVIDVSQGTVYTQTGFAIDIDNMAQSAFSEFLAGRRELPNTEAKTAVSPATIGRRAPAHEVGIFPLGLSQGTWANGLLSEREVVSMTTSGISQTRSSITSGVTRHFS